MTGGESYDNEGETICAQSGTGETQPDRTVCSRLSTTREVLGTTPEKAVEELRKRDLHYVNLAFIECRGLTEFIFGCDTTEDDLKKFLRECYLTHKTAGAVLKNPEAVINIRATLGELDLSVRFDQRSGLENKSHCTVHELYEYLREVER